MKLISKEKLVSVYDSRYFYNKDKIHFISISPENEMQIHARDILITNRLLNTIWGNDKEFVEIDDVINKMIYTSHAICDLYPFFKRYIDEDELTVIFSLSYSVILDLLEKGDLPDHHYLVIDRDSDTIDNMVCHYITSATQHTVLNFDKIDRWKSNKLVLEKEPETFKYKVVSRSLLPAHYPDKLEIEW